MLHIKCDKVHTEWRRCANSGVVSPSAGTRRIVRESQNELCHILFQKWNSCISNSRLKRRDSIHNSSDVMCRPSGK